MTDPRTAPTRKMPVVQTTKNDPRTAPTKILPAIKKESVIQKVIKLYATNPVSFWATHTRGK